MVKLSRIVKDYQDSGAVNALVNLFGFIDDHVFLTKSGEVGAVIRVDGRDYECLDNVDLNEITRRFEACVRSFDPAFRIYQYLVKRDGARIPCSDEYENPVVRQAVRSRVEYLEGKSEELYTIEIYFVILYEGSRHNLNIAERLKLIAKRPAAGLASMFSVYASVLLIDEAISRGHRILVNKVNSFVVQLQDYVPLRVADKAVAFSLFRRLLNFAHLKADSVALQHNTFLDYFVCDSQIECHRGFLRLDDYYVKILTLKEPPASTEPNMLKHLQELGSQCIIASEFKRIENFEMRKLIHNKRRHFHNSKTSVMSYLQPEQ